MPARDKFHDVVRNALIKEGWIITDDPLTFKFGKTDPFVDLGAEKLLAAEKKGKKIAVEIKSFLGKSIIAEAQDAIGQFMMYREVLLSRNAHFFLPMKRKHSTSNFRKILKI